MKAKHTVIIVGGGPAGSAAAFTLARRGVDVCLVDKAVFPREKLCGGLLTLRSQKVFATVFGADWDETYEYESRGISFGTRDGLLKTEENYSNLYFTRRLAFDDHLLNLARKAGAVIHEGEGVLSVDTEKQTCRLRSGQELGYNYLIGADSVNSIVAKALFGTSFDKNTIGFALEVDVDRSLVNRAVTLPEIYFDSVKWGYGWVFPKEQTLTVGVGGIHSLNPDMKEDFARFHQEVTGIPFTGKVKGHYIPFGDYRKTPGRGNILLAGDAAGLVEPITGEGIAFAMQSGYLVALSVAETLEGKTTSDLVKNYTGKLKVITKDIRYAKGMRYLVFPKMPQRILLRVLPTSTGIVRKHLDLMADELSYREYTAYLLRKIVGKALRKLVFWKKGVK